MDRRTFLKLGAMTPADPARRGGDDGFHDYRGRSFPSYSPGAQLDILFPDPLSQSARDVAQFPLGALVGHDGNLHLHHRQQPFSLSGDAPRPGRGPRPGERLATKALRALAMGWRGTAREWTIFRQASTLMAALIIPVAVSVHSIVAWDFAVTVVPGWHSTIFPPYFVIGAILSGVAAVITLMIIIRRVFHLEDYLTPIHFDNMGKLLLVISILWSYAYFVEVQTTWYAHEPIEWEVFSFMAGKYTPLLLIMLIGNSLLPIAALCFKRLRRSIRGHAGGNTAGQRRHVHRTLPDHRAVALPQEHALRLGNLRTILG